MSCWIKCLCRVYVCLGAMLPAGWGGIGVCVQLGAHRPAPALVVSEWPEQAKTQNLGLHALFPVQPMLPYTGQSVWVLCGCRHSVRSWLWVSDGIVWLLTSSYVCQEPRGFAWGRQEPGQGVQHLRLFCLWFGTMDFLCKIQHIFKYLQVGDKCG